MKPHVKNFEQFLESLHIDTEKETPSFVIKMMTGQQETETIDQAFNEPEAEFLVSEYSTKYGPDCKVWYEDNVEDVVDNTEEKLELINKALIALNDIPNSRTDRGRTYDLIPVIEQFRAEEKYDDALNLLYGIFNYIKNTKTSVGMSYDIASQIGRLM